MPRETLTDRRLKSLKPAAKGTRYEITDSIVPGLKVRVSDTGRKVFVLAARFPDPRSPTGYNKNMTRREVGVYSGEKLAGEDYSSLERARITAREWLELISKGVDPAKLNESKRAAAQERQTNTFGEAVATYLEVKVFGKNPLKPKLRSAGEIKRMLEVEFVNDRWLTGKKGHTPRDKAGKNKGQKRPGLKDRPITEVTKADILRVINDAIARDSESMAHNCLAYARAFFNWAIESGRYGLETSPCDRIKAKSMIGKKPIRKRVLNDVEIAALWDATTKMGYPLGDFYRMLLLTGLRRSEVAEAAWSEFDLKAKMWTVPKERMKKESDHHVPLSPLAVSLMSSLYTHDQGDFVFTTTNGEKAINGFAKAKRALDAEMLASLKRMAAKEDRDPDSVKLQPFVVHDIRRTVRTRLSSLGVSKVVAELVIAHTQKDLDAVYDQWAFIDERRKALELWAEKLRTIVEPAPNNVISLTGRTAQ